MLGSEPQPLSDSNALAIRIWNALCNGMGGLDWSGLPLQVELHGVQDVEALCDALLRIKLYRPRDDAQGAEADNDETP